MTESSPNNPSASDEFDRYMNMFESSDPGTGSAPTAPAGDEPTGEVEIASEAPSARRQLPFWLELPILVGVALIVAVLIKTFLFQAFFIPSGSMKETLQINDRVLVNKLAFNIGDLAHGDVVVFDDPRAGFEAPDEGVVDSAVRNLLESIGLAAPQSEFIKRVIGLEGDSIELRANQLYRNGDPVVEPYLAPDAVPPSTCPGSDFGPVVVPEGHILVMGDNRCHSSDGRSFGPISEEDVVGKAFVIIWPASRWGGL